MRKETVCVGSEVVMVVFGILSLKIQRSLPKLKQVTPISHLILRQQYYKNEPV